MRRLLTAATLLGLMFTGYGPLTTGALFTDSSALPGNAFTSGCWAPAASGPCAGVVTGRPGNPVSVSTYDTAALADNPIGYWPLTDDAAADNDAAVDHSGWQRPATYRGVFDPHAFQPPSGNPINTPYTTSWNAQGSAVVLPAAVTPQAGTAWTVETWVHPGDRADTTLLELGDTTSPTAPSGMAWRLGYDDPGYAVVQAHTPDGVLHQIGGWQAGGSPIRDGSGLWRHLALVYDPATQALKLYVDGALVGAAGGITGFTPVQATTITAGAPVVGNPSHALSAGGGLADIAVYPVALTDAQISAHTAAR